MPKWLNILDPNVVKAGMECRSCLDFDHPINISDDGDSEDPDDMDWFNAKVERVHRRRLDLDDEDSPIGLEVIVAKTNQGPTWSIFLYEDNLEYFLIKHTAWDE